MEATTAKKQTGNFVDFPSRREILDTLQSMEGYVPEIASLCDGISERLHGKTYDRSAFVFILIEMIYELEEELGSSLGHLLPRTVLALTGDVHLAASASDAFKEIKEAIAPPEEEGEGDEGVSEPVAELPSTAELLQPRTSADEGQVSLMRRLQSVQKRIGDLGLSTRMLIEMALSDADSDNVKWALQEISSLRSEIRQFEAHLSDAEERILIAAGVLE